MPLGTPPMALGHIPNAIGKPPCQASHTGMLSTIGYLINKQKSLPIQL